MAIFNSYIKLPEGMFLLICLLELELFEIYFKYWMLVKTLVQTSFLEDFGGMKVHSRQAKVHWLFAMTVVNVRQEFGLIDLRFLILESSLVITLQLSNLSETMMTYSKCNMGALV